MFERGGKLLNEGTACYQVRNAALGMQMHWHNYNEGMERNDFKRELQTASGCVPCIGIRISRRIGILDNAGILSY
jgi:hypothetical protein